MSKTVIIIPFYNEEKRFSLDQFNEFFYSSEVSFCLVNDGSNDNTLEMLKTMQHGRSDRIYVIDLKRNSGKSEAIRQGVLTCIIWRKFDFIGYFDADFATPLKEIPYLLKHFYNNANIQMVFGSRVKLIGRNIERNALRHYNGRLFSTMASIILNLPIYDTQCGAKIFRLNLASNIFDKPFMSRWIFDVEIFARIVNIFGHKNCENIMYEVPLNQWKEISGSKLALSNYIKAPYELLKIKYKYF